MKPFMTGHLLFPSYLLLQLLLLSQSLLLSAAKGRAERGYDWNQNRPATSEHPRSVSQHACSKNDTHFEGDALPPVLTRKHSPEIWRGEVFDTRKQIP